MDLLHGFGFGFEERQPFWLTDMLGGCTLHGKSRCLGKLGAWVIGRYRISESEPDLRCVSIVIGTTGVVPDRGS